MMEFLAGWPADGLNRNCIDTPPGDKPCRQAVKQTHNVISLSDNNVVGQPGGIDTADPAIVTGLVFTPHYCVPWWRCPPHGRREHSICPAAGRGQRVLIAAAAGTAVLRHIPPLNCLFPAGQSGAPQQ